MEKNINITERLKKCGAMVEKGSKIADVGTDHAYLPIYLIKEKKATHAIACDLREGPLENAKKNIKKFGLEEKIETRLSNGLENIKENEADEVIIAGMGGILISEILENCTWENKINKKFILQPMNHEKDLRVYLAKNGYETENEEAVNCMGKSYVVIKTNFTGKAYSLTDLEKYIGSLKAENEPSVCYIKKQLNDLQNRKKGANAKNETEKENYYSKLITQLENILEGRN